MKKLSESQLIVNSNWAANKPEHQLLQNISHPNN